MFVCLSFAFSSVNPFLLARIGDPNSNFYPDDPEAMAEAMSMIQNLLPKVSNWGGIALPGIIDLKALDT